MLSEDLTYIRYWDNESKAPYIFNQQDSIFITYDDPESLTQKSKYVIDHNIRGIMFWQLSHGTQDHKLVNSIYNQIKK